MSLEKPSRVKAMRELIAAVAGPADAFDNRKSWLDRAAEEAGVTYRQVKTLFYGERERPNPKVVAKLKEAAGRYEARNLAHQFEGLAQSLNVRDADFHSADVAALLSAARALRGLDRSGT
jgi:hypothetical protein